MTVNRPVVQVTRGVVFLPVVIGLASSSLLWVWLFDQQVGLFNKLLVDLGVIDAPMVWFNKADTGLLAVIISVVWKVVGFGMIIMLAGMQTINQEVIEAAMIDGASYWQRVRRIIVPLSSRAILLATLISAIGSMLAFDQFYLMTGGAPRGQTFTSVYWIYQNSFVYFKLGYGSALSIILMLVIMCGTALQLTLQRRGERGMSDVAVLPELARSRARSRRSRSAAAAAARYLVAAVCVFLIAVMLLPLVMSFLASVKTPAEASAVPPTYLPHALSIENYRAVCALPGRACGPTSRTA